MTTWSEFSTVQPELAAAIRATFVRRKHATMATLRADGSPRISGTEIDFADDGEVYVEMMPGTRRAADLRRDPRIAVHCPTVDPPADDPTAWAGEGKMSGIAVETRPDRFRIEVNQATLTAIADGALVITSWSPGTAPRTVRRD